MNQREAVFVDSFIAPVERARASRVLTRRHGDRKARSKFKRWIAGPVAIEASFARELPSSITPSEILGLMAEGQPASWWIISTTGTDATEVASSDAIGALFDGVGPVILCDESGTVAFYGTEHPPGRRYILKRPLPASDLTD